MLLCNSKCQLYWHMIKSSLHEFTHPISYTDHNPSTQHLVIKATSNFSNLFSEWNSTCFRQFLCPSSGGFHCTRSNGTCHTGLLTACEQDQDRTAVPSWSCSLAVSKPVWHIPLPCVQWKTPDDGQGNCTKHVEFHSKNKFEKISASSWFCYKVK